MAIVKSFPWGGIGLSVVFFAAGRSLYTPMCTHAHMHTHLTMTRILKFCVMKWGHLVISEFAYSSLTLPTPWILCCLWPIGQMLQSVAGAVRHLQIPGTKSLGKHGHVQVQTSQDKDRLCLTVHGYIPAQMTWIHGEMATWYTRILCLLSWIDFEKSPRTVNSKAWFFTPENFWKQQ